MSPKSLAVAATLLLAAAAAALSILVSPPASAGTQQSVSFSVFRIWDQACRCFKLRFTGSVSSSAQGEDVVVLRQTCGYSFSTAIAGAQTRGSGFWEAEYRPAPRPGHDTNLYRARWKGVLSEPVKFRGRMNMAFTKLGGGRFRVIVWKWTEQQEMAGRQVVLQRLVQGRWNRIDVARLRHSRDATAWEATFRVRARGWTLRAVVPTKNARPCFNASATRKWTTS